MVPAWWAWNQVWWKMKGQLLPFRRPKGDQEEISDEALLKECAAGEQAALAQLFDRHHYSVRRFLGRLNGVDSDALDDLIQTTFLEIYRSAKRFKGQSKVRTWIFGIAVNIARHHIRSESRRKKFRVAYAQRSDTAIALPDTVTDNRRLMNRLRKAVVSLPHRLKAVFVLCDIEGISGVEAAQILGLREGTLYRRLHEARQLLRKEVEGGER